MNKDQKKAFEYMTRGKSIFLTGPAGTGKTYLIKYFKEWADDSGKSVALTALTGVAGYLIGGQTLHSWTGLGLAQGTVEDCIERVNKCVRVKAKFRTTDCLVIDEVSMMTPDLLEKVEAVIRTFRNKTLPFGGMQVVFCGDFFQLPPVKGYNKFAFHSKIWNSVIEHVVVLNQIVRQTDPVFQTLLNEVRIGELSDNSKELLVSRIDAEVQDESGVMPTRLYTTKVDVETINIKKLAEIQSEPVKYTAVFGFTPRAPGIVLDQTDRTKAQETMIREVPAEQVLTLKVGAQVMLTCNLDTQIGLVNGSRGVVLDFQKGIPVVKFHNGAEMSVAVHSWDHVLVGRGTFTMTQIPLKLAWACTIHKSQGMTLDLAEIDVGSSIFEYHQTYVALSRIRNLDGLRLLDLDLSKIKVHPEVKKYYSRIQT